MFSGILAYQVIKRKNVSELKLYRQRQEIFYRNIRVLAKKIKRENARLLKESKEYYLLLKGA